MDIHDICRAGKPTASKVFISSRRSSRCKNWRSRSSITGKLGYGSQYNVTRKDALALARICDNLDDAIIDIDRETGQKPLIVVTSARTREHRGPLSSRCKKCYKLGTQPFLVIFGTGWGLTETIISQADYVLEAVEGGTDYNHLSVRSRRGDHFGSPFRTDNSDRSSHEYYWAIGSPTS